MLWMFVAIALTELVVVHAVLSVWFAALAIPLSLLSLSAICWAIWAIRSFESLPVTLDATTLRMRVGRMKGVDVPIDRIGGLMDHFTAETFKDRSVRNFALIAFPNVVVKIDPPLMMRRLGKEAVIAAIAHRLDDPAAFVRAIEALGQRP